VHGITTTTPAIAQELSNETLESFPRGVAVPSYDRAALEPSIVHLGAGGFHRAHQAIYLDDLANRGMTAWGVVAVGLRQARLSGVLPPQDCLYTVVERAPEGDSARVVGSITDYISGPARPAAVLRALAAAQTKIVTLTVTGDGYKVDRSTGAFEHDDQEIARDLRNPTDPRTVPGFLVEALRLRLSAGLDPFTIVSCDNLPANGKAVRTSVVEFARLRDPALAARLDAELHTPSTVVDRITPGTSLRDRQFVAQEFSMLDRGPVITEPFAQWIIEDDFNGHRPPLDEVGARFVPDAAPYALVKKRLLNGGHCAIAYLGQLCGHDQTDEVMNDGLTSAFLEELMQREIAPLLPAVPGLDLEEYRETLLERFGNPAVGDRLQRLAERGSTKMPGYLLPSLHEAVDSGRPHRLLTFAVAAWLNWLARDARSDGDALTNADPMHDPIRELVRMGGTDPRPVLACRTVFGDLGDRPLFVQALGDALARIERDGPRAALAIELYGDSAVAA
jgi:mannitol-1-phosphate/altronate dehydrogenase